MGMVTQITQGERFDGASGGIVVTDDGIEGVIKPDAILAVHADTRDVSEGRCGHHNVCVRSL